MTDRDRSRDDFYSLDDYSYERCLQIAEEHENVSMELNRFLHTIDADEIKVETLDAFDEVLASFGKGHAVKLRRSIIAQMKSKLTEATT